MKTLFNLNFTFLKFICPAIIVAVLSGAAFGATFTVTRTDDRNAVCVSGSDCSLREAVQAASSAPGSDVIEFSTDLTLITLANEIKIQVPSGTIAIIGRGANIFTINGGVGNNRIFSSIFATVTLSGMTLTGGNGVGENRNGFGGAIQADGGSLTLDSVHITGNSTSSAGGGVIFENGTYRIINSTFSANTAFNCGAVSNGGNQLTIVNSTISGNTAQQLGGGLCSSYTTTLRNVTITGNTASSGGGILQSATGTLNLGNTIVAGNGATEIRINTGAITSVGNNLIGDLPGDSANTGMPISYQPSDILDTPPMLGALQNNGGATPTHAFLSSSPAIDKGNNSLAVDPFNNSILLNDQRGFARLNDGDGAARVDIGAFEVRPVLVTNINESGVGSIRQALLDVITQGDAVVFSANTFNSPQTIALTSGELIIPQNANFTLNGSGADRLTISGNNQSRVFFINNGANVVIGGLTITGGNSAGASASGNGGGIRSSNNVKLTLINSVVRNNSATESGGGIDLLGTNLILINTLIGNNSAGGDGGGIRALDSQNGAISLNNAVITSNTAVGTGGGIHNFSLLSATNSTISNNSADGDGGGIYTYGAAVTIVSSVVSNNATNVEGGGIHNLGNLSVTNSTLNGNSAQFNGGGIYNGQVTTFNNSTVSGNSAIGFGGGVFNEHGATSSFTGATVANNNANSIGGGVFNSSTGTVNARNTIFADNRAVTQSPDFERTLTSQGYNLIENTTGTIITGATIGNILGQDPRLLPLGNYGGATQTHALRINSPAIDKGNSFSISTDQRGQFRPYNFLNIPNGPGGNGSDIGAFERQPTDISNLPSFDFDGDNKADISVFRPANGVWYLQQSTLRWRR